MAKCFPVALERGCHMDLVRRISFQHFVLRDQALRAFGEKYLVTELYGCSHLAALDQVSMRFEDGIDLLGVGHLLAIEHAAARLIDDTASQVTIVRDRVTDIRDGQIGKHVLAVRRTGVLKYHLCPLYNLLGNGDERAICLPLLPVPLSCGHALDLLHPTPSRTSAITKTLETSMIQRCSQVAHHPRDHPYRVPQQSVVRRVMNVRLNHRCIDPQLRAIL